MSMPPHPTPPPPNPPAGYGPPGSSGPPPGFGPPGVLMPPGGFGPPGAPPPARPGSFSPMLRFILISLVSFALLIPLFALTLLRQERAGRAAEAAADIGAVWGRAQTVTGPFVVIPYVATVQRQSASGTPTPVEVTRVAVIFPDRLDSTVEAPTEIRTRGIFEVPVYRARLHMKASFAPKDIRVLDPDFTRLAADRAVLAVRVSDVAGLESGAVAMIGTTSRAFAPSIAGGRFPVTPDTTATPDTLRVSGMHVPLTEAEATGALSVEVRFGLKGTTSLALVPVGQDSAITLRSDWPHPSFGVTGGNERGLIPDRRTISAAGFEAEWRTSHLAGNVAPVHAVAQLNAGLFPQRAAAVTLIEPVGLYAQVERTTKYAVLFIGAAFSIVFLLELVTRKPMHPVQYGLVGLTLVMFYLLLLSLSEHIGFTRSYAVAAGAVVAVVAAYVGLARRAIGEALVVALALAASYLALFFLVRAEDYALLAGSIGAFLLLALFMIATARLDWSRMTSRSEPLPSQG